MTLPDTEPRRPSAEAAQTFDFRSPGKLAREHVRNLEVVHETFARRLGSALTNALRAVVHLELAASQQLTYEDFARSIPNPTVMAVIALPPFPGVVVVELNVQMGLTLVDRLLGGNGRPVGVRRPTELEAALLSELLEHARDALTDTFGPFTEGEAQLEAVEFNPHLLQVAASSEMVLVLSYTVAISHGSRSDGLLTLCYPFSLLQPLIERLGRQGWEARLPVPDDGDVAGRLVADHISETHLSLQVRLTPSRVPARDLANLAVGDVLKLDHRVDRPVVVRAGGIDLFDARLGRRGRRRAIEILARRKP